MKSEVGVLRKIEEDHKKIKYELKLLTKTKKEEGVLQFVNKFKAHEELERSLFPLIRYAMRILEGKGWRTTKHEREIAKVAEERIMKLIEDHKNFLIEIKNFEQDEELKSLKALNLDFLQKHFEDEERVFFPLVTRISTLIKEQKSNKLNL
ncbi:MAG: hypothetical protein QXS21_04855 [Thermoproteota archaeon]|nr:hypothetical protein [Candidatus Brockarchaeota archaeon]